MKAILLCLGSSVLAQNIDPTYGDNYTPVSKDDDAIARNFPDIDIDLLSPAFLNPETVPEGGFCYEYVCCIEVPESC
jgi:hypothetical protein